jgi:hypothetical protein
MSDLPYITICKNGCKINIGDNVEGVNQLLASFSISSLDNSESSPNKDLNLKTSSAAESILVW